MSDSTPDFAPLAAAEDPAAAVRAALKPVLTQGKACEDIFARLFANIASVAVADGKLIVTVINDEDEECELEFNPPYTGEAAADVPPSFLELVRRFNGMGYDGYLPMGLNGLSSPSIQSTNGGWEYQAITEAEDENASLLAGLKKAGLSAKDIPGPIDFFQNWLILNLAEKNALGEPALYFVSHGDCVATPIPEAAALKWGPIMLRVLTQAVMDEDADYFAAVYD